ncbi:DHA2 family efflux MFS transporter permease subunit [Sodalis praecaptivus]|uniref:DHA2 family efflux MFS transporter permease subunit n=1 Tax=Sodalis praecaptivus TaxID=1239307 RepID=UPI0031F837B7
MLDTNIVAVALPAIARDLHGEFTDVEWVISAYLLPFAGLLMPAGALADRLGRRRVLYLGLVLFTMASLLCALAPNLLVLNLARALQAVGGAMQLTASLAVIAHGFAPQYRARVYAIWATVMGVAPVLGAILGGLITTHLGWRWGFYINVPIGFALMAVGFGSVSESRDPQAERLDVVGILFFGAGLSTLVWPLIEANRVGWGSPQTLITLAFGVALLVIFVFAERRHPRPMIDLTLFKAPAVIGAAAAMLGYAAAGQLMMTILPVYLQDAFGQSAAQAGVAMIPFALPLLLGPSLGAVLAARLTFGLAMLAVGDAALAVAVCAGAGYWAMMVAMAIVGLATGVLNSETTKAQVSAVPPDRAGMASGIAGTTRFIGLTVGLTGIGAILTAAAENGLRRLGTQIVSADSVDWHAVNLRIVGGDAAGALSDLPLAIRMLLGHAVRASVASGFTAAFTAAAVTAMVSSILAWYLLRGTRPGAPPPR